MTVSNKDIQYAGGLTILTADCINKAAFCAICGHPVHGNPGTPRIPADRFADDALAMRDGDIPVWGYVCQRHRDEVINVAPPERAPSNYRTVDAQIDGAVLAVAVPEPVYREVATV